MLVSPSAVVPTVKILAIQVRLAVHNDVKRLPSYLRCFPSVESLHIQARTILLHFSLHVVACISHLYLNFI
jgi:hypothetical protein